MAFEPRPLALGLLWLGLLGPVAAQTTHPAPQKPSMRFLGAFESGMPHVSIVKLLDPTDDVLCYVLMPDHASRKQVDKDTWVYEANTVGAISCLKVKVPVVPLLDAKP